MGGGTDGCSVITGRSFHSPLCWGSRPPAIRHHYIRPRRPQQNGKVERSHRIDQEEFWCRQRFPDFEAAAAALRGWETRYNYERFSLALQGRTPAEKLAALSSSCLRVPDTQPRGSILTRPNKRAERHLTQRRVGQILGRIERLVWHPM